MSFNHFYRPFTDRTKTKLTTKGRAEDFVLVREHAVVPGSKLRNAKEKERLELTVAVFV